MSIVLGEPWNERWRATLRWMWLVPCALCGTATSLTTQFVVNQNTYLAHAAAGSGRFPQLEGDWFAHTLDPTPFFTWLVIPFLALAGKASLIVLNALCGTLGLASLVLAAESLQPDRAPRVPRWIASTALAAAWLAGPSPWFWFDGVAGQFVFGNYLQPSNFGVLLITGMALFMRGRLRSAAAIAALAGLLHPTYVPSVLLIVGCELALTQPLSWSTRRVVAAIALVVVLPSVLWTATHFGPSDPETFRSAQRIIADVRIPHHTNPAHWLDHSVAYRGLMVAVAILLARPGGKVRLLTFAGFGFLGTLAAVEFPKLYALKLAFPWRVSVWLVPLATSVVLTTVLAQLVRALPRLTAAMAALGLIFALGVGTVSGLQRMHGRPGPGLALARVAHERGSPADVLVIPPRWEHLRLNTPTAVFVDWKSHPYADREVLEWHRRVKLTYDLYEGSRATRCEALLGIRRTEPGAVWLLAPPNFALDCPDSEPVARDKTASLYRLAENR